MPLPLTTVFLVLATLGVAWGRTGGLVLALVLGTLAIFNETLRWALTAAQGVSEPIAPGTPQAGPYSEPDDYDGQ